MNKGFLLSWGAIFAFLLPPLMPQTAFAQTQWRTAFWHPADGNLPFANIPANKYTHVVQEQIFVTFNGSTCAVDGSFVDGSGGSSGFVSAVHAGGAKALVSMLGDSAHASAFQTCTNSTHISQFASAIAAFLTARGYDGIDIDWEQGIIGSQYSALFPAVRSAIGSTKTLTSSCIPLNFRTSVGAPGVVSAVDQLNYCVYDYDQSGFSGANLSYAWYQTNIYPNPSDPTNAVSADALFNYFVAAGVPIGKLGFGIPFYGRIKTGNVAGNCGAFIDQPNQHYCTGDAGSNGRAFIPWRTLSSSAYMTDGHGTHVLDTTSMGEYIKYDNGSSTAFVNYAGPMLIQKISDYIKTKGLGGALVYDLQYEYVPTASTTDTQHPLTTALYSAMVGGSGSAPTISSFTASPSTIAAGSSSTLSWSTSGATSLSIDQGVGPVTGTTSKVVSPTVTTTYTLTATNSTGSVTKSVPVSVSANTPPPSISSFTANPGSTAPGGTSMLSWVATGATSLSINQGVGVVTNTNSIAVNPAGTTTYTLTASNASGSVTMPTTITVSSASLAYWKLDGSGTTAVDSSGNSHTMALFNTPGWLTASSCALNGCLAFNGINQYGSSVLDLSATNVITLALWLKWTAYANDNRIALEFTPNFNNTSTGFLILPDDSVSGQFQAGVQGNAGYNQVNFPRPSAGVWHHYAFVIDKGASAATQVIPYVDGQAVSYTKPTAAANINNFGKDTLFAMSRNGTSLFGSGDLDELYIFPRALSATEIGTLASASSSPNITTTSPLSTGTVALPYSQTLSSSGSTPITWALTSGVLPSGLSLSSSSGIISGTPSTAGSSSFIAGATNAAGSDSQQFSLTVNPKSSALNYNVSNLNWTSESIGWGTIHLNASVLGNVITLNRVTYTEGIGTHADSQIFYNIGNDCNTFQSDVGADDEVGSAGSVDFQVFGDGVKLYDSGLMSGSSATQKISVSVAGHNQLGLVVNHGGTNINFDHADWANPRLACSSVPPAAN